MPAGGSRLLPAVGARRLLRHRQHSRRPSGIRHGAGRRGIDRRARTWPVDRRRPGARRAHARARLPRPSCCSATARSTRARSGKPRWAPAKHGLDNLVALIDYNKLQSYGPTDYVLPLEPLADKWRSFRLRGRASSNGHDVGALARRARARFRRRGPADGDHLPHRQGQGHAGSPNPTPTGITRTS